MTKFIAVSSGKGGVGKTTTAINLGTAISLFGRQVVVLDSNFATPNINIHLGAPVVPVTLNDVLRGDKHITQAVYEHDSGLRIIPANISLDSFNKKDMKRLKDVILDLESFYDYVIIDTAAGLNDDALVSLKAADEVLIVTNPELPAVTDALKTIKTAVKHKATVIGVVVSKVRDDHYELSFNNIESILEYPVIGVIPHDNTVREALYFKHPLIYTHPKSPASVAYKKLAATILGEPYDEAPISTNLGWFGKLLIGLGLK